MSLESDVGILGIMRILGFEILKIGSFSILSLNIKIRG